MSFLVSNPAVEDLVNRLAAAEDISKAESIRRSVHEYLVRHHPDALPDETATVSTAGVVALETKLRRDTDEYAEMVRQARGKRAKGSRIYGMITRHGPVETVVKLVQRPSEGLLFLAARDRLDLAAECLVLDPRFAPLFSTEVKARAQANLDYATASRANS